MVSLPFFLFPSPCFSRPPRSTASSMGIFYLVSFGLIGIICVGGEAHLKKYSYYYPQAMRGSKSRELSVSTTRGLALGKVLGSCQERLGCIRSPLKLTFRKSDLRFLQRCSVKACLRCCSVKGKVEGNKFWAVLLLIIVRFQKRNWNLATSKCHSGGKQFTHMSLLPFPLLVFNHYPGGK